MSNIETCLPSSLQDFLSGSTVAAPTLPQSLWLEELAEAILDFFLLSFSFSPARTTSLLSLRHPGQYLTHYDR